MDDSLNQSLTESISSDNLGDIADLALEKILDTENSILEDVPVFGTLVKVYKLGAGIRDHLFVKKISNFLYSLNEIPKKERTSFVEEITNDPKKHRRFSETLLLLIERSDNLDKPRIIGNIVKALIRGKLEYEFAMRLCNMVDRTYYQDLLYLVKDEDYNRNPTIAEQLRIQGFLDAKITDFEIDQPAGKNNVYELNDYGLALIKHGFNNV